MQQFITSHTLKGCIVYSGVCPGRTNSWACRMQHAYTDWKSACLLVFFSNAFFHVYFSYVYFNYICGPINHHRGYIQCLFSMRDVLSSAGRRLRASMKVAIIFSQLQARPVTSCIMNSCAFTALHFQDKPPFLK